MSWMTMTLLATSSRPWAAGALEGLDAVVLALGAKGMRGVVAGSPVLARTAPELSKAAALVGLATSAWSVSGK